MSGFAAFLAQKEKDRKANKDKPVVKKPDETTVKRRQGPPKDGVRIAPMSMMDELNAKLKRQ